MREQAREQTHQRRKPRIVVSEMDYESLSRLAQTSAGRFPEIAEILLDELDRARVARASALPDNVVRMGSTIIYRADSGPEKTVQLVFPAEADISQGKISILTPVGTALLGLSDGQSIGWTARDGRRHELTVIAANPEASQ